MVRTYSNKTEIFALHSTLLYCFEKTHCNFIYLTMRCLWIQHLVSAMFSSSSLGSIYILVALFNTQLYIPEYSALHFKEWIQCNLFPYMYAICGFNTSIMHRFQTLVSIIYIWPVALFDTHIHSSFNCFHLLPKIIFLQTMLHVER